MDVVQLNRVLMDCALFGNIYVEGYQVDHKGHVPHALHAAAARYGVPMRDT